MIRSAVLFVFIFFVSSPLSAQYFPGDWGDWETRTPESMGFNADSIASVIEYAISNESTTTSMEETIIAFSGIIW